jgi:hypothetical protein
MRYEKLLNGIRVDNDAYTTAEVAVKENFEKLDQLLKSLGTISVLGSALKVVSGDGKLWNAIASQELGGGWGIITPDDGNSVSCEFACRAGTYTIEVLTAKGAAFGIVDVYLDGVLIDGTNDLYAASSTPNTKLTTTGVVLTAGTHTITVTVNGKNASSSDYNAPISTVSVREE